MSRFAWVVVSVVAVVAVGLGSPGQARGQVFTSAFFDDFVFDNAGQPGQNLNDFINFNVTGGSVDLVGGTVPGATQYPVGRFVDLGGSTGQPGVFATRLPVVLVPGLAYTLSFQLVSTEALLALGGPGADTLGAVPDGPLDAGRASLDGKTFTFSTANGSFGQFSTTFVASTTGTPLSFQDLGFTDPVTGAVRFDNSGVGIDTVLVAPVVVREPATAGALAVAGLATLTRRRRRTA